MAQVIRQHLALWDYSGRHQVELEQARGVLTGKTAGGRQHDRRVPMPALSGASSPLASM
jgi:hypothetical protein